jgi:hypothetical protein
MFVGPAHTPGGTELHAKLQPCYKHHFAAEPPRAWYFERCLLTMSFPEERSTPGTSTWSMSIWPLKISAQHWLSCPAWHARSAPA